MSSNQYAKNEDIKNWVWRTIKWTSSTHIQPLITAMVKSDSSGKSSISSKESSIRKAAKGSMKAIARPFKKLKALSATSSHCSSRSSLSTMAAANYTDAEETDEGHGECDSDPEHDVSSEDELSMYIRSFAL